MAHFHVMPCHDGGTVPSNLHSLLSLDLHSTVGETLVPSRKTIYFKKLEGKRNANLKTFVFTDTVTWPAGGLGQSNL